MLKAMMRTLVMAVAVVGTHGVAIAQLQGRDINGDGSIDAYYDVVQDLTWLADANFAATSGYVQTLPLPFPSEFMMWTEATSWAAQLNYYGTTGWRLPDFVSAPGGAAPGSLGGMFDGYSCAEIPARFCSLGPTEVDLLIGQIGGGAGSFTNLSTTWLGSTFGADHYGAVQSSLGGSLLLTNELQASTARAGAWAVRDGDVTAVTPVPEPSTYALMLAGLGVVAFVAGRRRNPLPP